MDRKGAPLDCRGTGMDWAEGEAVSSLKSRTNAKHGTVFTAERIELIRQNYPCPVKLPLPTLLERLNELPGSPITDTKRIIIQASTMGLNRNGMRQAGAGTGTGGIVERDPGEAVTATLERVAAWAIDHGIRFRDWEDLPAVNDLRFHKRRATFKRDFGRGAR